jgi:hypothetical protein
VLDLQICAATVTWESLTPDTQHAIDARSAEEQLTACPRRVTPPPTIRLPHAMGVLDFRYKLGVGADSAG